MKSSQSRPERWLRSGLTLVEIMIALTMTLIVLGAMMTAFQFASEQMQMGRGVMEMANRLRAAEELMRSDLSNLTVDPRPYTESTAPNGYFEIVEGPQRDYGAYSDGTSGSFPFTANATLTGILDTNSNGIPDPVDFTIDTPARVAVGSSDVDGNNVDDLYDTTFPGNSYRGDHDDVWMGTVRSENQPFRGRYVAPSATVTVPSTTLPTVDFTQASLTAIIESPIAEIVWWTDYDDLNNNYVADFNAESITVYRRVLLIRPGLPLPAFATLDAAMRYLATNDISARVVILPSGNFQVVANDINDLANRQNRYCHHPLAGAPASFPQYLNRLTLRGLRSADYVSGGASVVLNGNDIVLTDVAAFDLKVYSPNAGVKVEGGVTVDPSDIGFVSSGSATAGIGAFVDLGHVGGGWFSGSTTPLSQLTYQYRFDLAPAAQLTGLMDLVYDTWTPLYESDGIDQNMDGLVDEGTNGLDDRGPVAPDDDSERETRPPYPYPVRGVKATIRLIEKNTKQVHQSSVVHSYVPE